MSITDVDKEAGRVLNKKQANDQSVHAVAGIELFHSIQDPVLITTPEGVIIDVNRATLKAARKSRDEIVGKGICQIIHGGRWPHIQCPLEEYLLTCRGKSEDTRLPGLGGEYHLTITPLVDTDEQVRSILLQARRLTREESLKVGIYPHRPAGGHRRAGSRGCPRGQQPD